MISKELHNFWYAEMSTGPLFPLSFGHQPLFSPNRTISPPSLAFSPVAMKHQPLGLQP